MNTASDTNPELQTTVREIVQTLLQKPTNFQIERAVALFSDLGKDAETVLQIVAAEMLQPKRTAEEVFAILALVSMTSYKSGTALGRETVYKVLDEQAVKSGGHIVIRPR